MELTKENVYIDLIGKSKEELNLITEITGVENLKNYYYLHFCTPLNKWVRYHVWTDNTENKQEVTIEQLKEILQPMELSLTEQLQKAEAEVKRLQSLIEEENKPKIGDWCYFYDDSNKESKVIGKLSEFTTLYYTGDFNFDRCEKITNPELIKLLENE